MLASLYIRQIYKNINIAVLSSDANINNEDEFCKILTDANDALDTNVNGIITIGIRPNRPETGYGYIECSNNVNYINDREIVKVNRFVEKPNIEKAQEYINKGNYLWNAGMFIFNLNYMLKQLEENLNKEYNFLNSLPSINSEYYMDMLNEKYYECESISIDYAVMEKNTDIYVIPSDFGWDDVGTWNSIERYIDKDECNNITVGNIETSNSSNCVIYGGKKKVILIDMEDLFFVEGEDTIVISKKQSMDKVKNFRK